MGSFLLAPQTREEELEGNQERREMDMWVSTAALVVGFDVAVVVLMMMIGLVEWRLWCDDDGGGSVDVGDVGRVDKRRRRVGFGIIVRDEEGRVLRCWAQGCEANYDMDCADALAIHKGLSVGRDMALVNFIVETDSENSVVSDFEKVDFNFVPSKANRVASALANKALRLKDMAEWKEDAPMCIRALVEDEQRS
ncbi:hypothetical protein LWI28_008524 [Acer negundo]|uniref:RNase H type-1 domain-containing protein n=1 Tax=Acer negundo TaxID=4023 RepID=A0AAD5J9V4_ACENE|nr:hypothetical protein LWI28_008524 [Acer negundo]